MDIHAITPRSVEHILSVVDGELIIVPPPAATPPEPALAPAKE